MEVTIQATSVSNRVLWTGRVLSGIAILFMLFDSAIKILGVAAATQGTAQLGYPVSAVLPIGVIELVCVIAYMVPRTSLLGAVLLTGYLGGAIATHVRIESPLFTHILFPIYVAALIWGGLLLRDAQVRSLFPFRQA